MGRLTSLIALGLLSACETYYLPIPDWNGDGEADWLRLPTTALARCELRDDDRTSCISDCNEVYVHGGEAYGRCVARCDARHRACGATGGPPAPVALSQTRRQD